MAHLLGGLGWAAQGVAAVVHRLNSPWLAVVAVVVTSGLRPAINAGVRSGFGDDPLFDQPLHAVHGSVLKLGHQTSTRMAALRGLRPIRWVAAVNAWVLAWRLYDACAGWEVGDLHLSDLLGGRCHRLAKRRLVSDQSASGGQLDLVLPTFRDGSVTAPLGNSGLRAPQGFGRSGLRAEVGDKFLRAHTPHYRRSDCSVNRNSD